MPITLDNVIDYMYPDIKDIMSKGKVRIDYVAHASMITKPSHAQGIFHLKCTASYRASSAVGGKEEIRGGARQGVVYCQRRYTEENNGIIESSHCFEFVTHLCRRLHRANASTPQ